MPRRKTEARLAQEFGRLLPFVALILASLLAAPRFLRFLPWEAKTNAFLPLVAGGIALWLVSVVLPAVWLGIYRLWMRFVAHPLAWVMTRVLLAVFFFAVMTPFVLVLRLFGKRFLDTGFRDGATSFWREHETAEPTLERYRKQF